MVSEAPLVDEVLMTDCIDVFLRSPLCVEEFDLSDKNFRPCPCGYQVWLRPSFVSPIDEAPAYSS